MVAHGDHKEADLAAVVTTFSVSALGYKVFRDAGKQNGGEVSAGKREVSGALVVGR